MKPITTFGVGCFHFGMNLEPPYRFRPADYAEIIRSLLSNLDTVGHFSVSPSPRASSNELDLTEHALSILHRGISPLSYIHAVEFSLRIPQRVQQDIVKKIRGHDYPWTGLGTDHVMVRTRYFFHGPVTVVECLDLDDKKHKRPSDAVVVVREYLKQKLKESATDIQLECLGPSPFHANFFLFDTNELEEPRVDHMKKRGYDIINLYPPAYISGDRTAWVLQWMGDHLSFYYRMKRLGIQKRQQWERVAEAWGNLIEPPSSGSWSDRVRAPIRKRRAIASLVDGVLMFRAGMLSSRQASDSAWKNIQTKNDYLEFLDKSVDDVFEKTFSAYPTSEVLELAKFYETRDAKWRDRAYVLLAAVMGGAIGALLSQLPRVVEWIEFLLNQPG